MAILPANDGSSDSISARGIDSESPDYPLDLFGAILHARHPFSENRPLSDRF